MWPFFSVPAIFIIIGIVLWIGAPKSRPKVSEFGSKMVTTGLVVLCWSLSMHYFPPHH
jgi:hypothetical protein